MDVEVRVALAVVKPFPNTFQGVQRKAVDFPTAGLRLPYNFFYRFGFFVYYDEKHFGQIEEHKVYSLQYCNLLKTGKEFRICMGIDNYV